MTLKDDRETLDTTLLPSGQQREYLILSDAERARGFVRPVRQTYRHVGPAGPQHPTRELTAEEHERYDAYGYVRYEAYPEEAKQGTGRFWTQAQLDKVEKRGCGRTTTMAVKLAETYSRQPDFYNGTFCCTCGTHLPVGAHGEFVWVEEDGTDGPRVGT